MGRKIKTIQDVVDWGLCIGCGACAYACTKDAVTLADVEDAGIRPRFDAAKCADCVDCVPYCPGLTVDAGLLAPVPEAPTAAEREFGPALEIWEGYAALPEVRHNAASGGLLSALTLFCLEREDLAPAVHVAMDPERPWLNRTATSRTREDVLAWTGSRYAPASPCEGLGALEESDRPGVFIGKPCDAAGAALACRERPALKERMGLLLSFCCAGAPSTRGTLELLKSLEIGVDQIGALRYRGEGWPGGFKVRRKDGEVAFIPYREAWSRLNKFRPFRCNLCPDGLGRVADISCGDAWQHFSGADDNPGRSLCIVRTERGREILRRAREAGYVELEPLDAQGVLDAQENLLKRRREIHGRLLAMKLLAIPTPRLAGFSLKESWRAQPLKRRVKSVLGTLRRLLVRGLWRRRPLD